MVFHFTIRGGPCLNAYSHITLASSDIICYVGKDKHENEFLIKYGWPGDIWFHVDSLSSAHVYFRITNKDMALPVTGIPIDDLPVDSVYDMMQIVKNNSISGCKLASTRIVYTPHSNLKKTFDMESGTVTFHDMKLCRYARCDKDKNRIKELEKTKTERVNVDFFEEMKENERRIIERKRMDKEERRKDSLEAKAIDMERQQMDKFGLYDPIREDLRTSRIRANRLGDEDSGIDKGLAALESLSFSTTSTPVLMSAADKDTLATSKKEDNPTWTEEAESRLLEPSPNVRFLRARGYEYANAVDALKINRSRIAALRTLWLSTRLTSPSLSSDSTIEEAAEARQDEKEVLRAIFGEDEGVRLSDDETLFDAAFPIMSYEPPSRYRFPPPLFLEVYVDEDIAPLYPYQPPVLALVGGGLPEVLLKELTNRLRMEVLKRSMEEPGDPLIFNLISFVGEEVDKIIQEETIELAEKRKIQLEEEKAAASELKLKAQAEMELDHAPQPSESKTTFANDEERRSYAKDVISRVNTSKSVGNDKKQVGKVTYNTGVSDKSLIKDLFG